MCDKKKTCLIVTMNSSSSSRLLDSLAYADGDCHPDYEAYALTLVQEECHKSTTTSLENKKRTHFLLSHCLFDYENYNGKKKKRMKRDIFVVDHPKEWNDTVVQRARAAYEERVHHWTKLQVLHHILPSIQTRWQESVATIKQKNQYLETIALPTIQNEIQDINTKRYDSQVVSQTGIQFKRYQYQYQQLIPKCQSIQFATNTLQKEIKHLKQILQQETKQQSTQP